MPEQDSGERNFMNEVGAVGVKYASTSGRKAITFGEEGERLQQEKDTLYAQLVNVLAQGMLENPDSGISLLGQARHAIRPSYGTLPESLVADLNQDVAVRIARMAREKLMGFLTGESSEPTEQPR